MHALSYLSLLALAATSYALPGATRTAVSGAESTHAVARAAAYASPPEHMTIVVINKHGDSITTSLDSNPGDPTPVSGNKGAGTMTNGETASLVLPTGWIGNIAINDAKYGITGDDSLIESNFVIPYEASVAVADIDISYVNGFSVAIVCSCGENSPIITGCNKDLFSLNSCPDNDGKNACVNPLRNNLSATSASSFFAPCQGAAYTFPNDGAANSFGTCQSTAKYVCCVGKECQANPKQPA